MSGDAPTQNLPDPGRSKEGGNKGGAQLVVVEGKDRGLAMPLTAKETTIGRRSGNDLVLDSEGVSRQHGKVIRKDDGYYIQDLGSTHGILVNGVPLKGSEARRLAHGDQLGFYDQVVLFRQEGSASPLPNLSPIDIDKARVRAEADAFLKGLSKEEKEEEEKKKEKQERQEKVKKEEKDKKEDGPAS